MKKALVLWARLGERTNHQPRLSLHRAMGEIYGARLMERLSIGAPDVELVPRNEPGRGTDWISKFAVGDRVLVVKKIPGAISLHYLWLLHSVKSAPSVWRAEKDAGQLLEKILGLGIDRVDGLQKLLDFGKFNQVKNPNEFHRDFSLPEDSSAIQRAIAWDSEQRLEIHAARLLLGCSTAHAGNVLVDSSAKLYSIDHETCTFSDSSDDVQMLAEHIRRPSRAYSVVREVVNRISLQGMDSLFDGLPDLAWPLGTKGATVAYFKQRIRLFQQKFPA